MPTEWVRKSWAPGASGWPTFDEDGKRVDNADEADEEEDDA